MKQMRLLILVAIAALTVIALGGAGTASATVTVLCDSNADSPTCEGEDQYASGTTLTASSTDTSIGFKGGILPWRVDCSSTLSIETDAQGGNPLPATVEDWTLEGCRMRYDKEGSAYLWDCTSETVNLPYDAGFQWSEGADGVLAVEDGGKGSPGWHLYCEGGSVDCTVTFEPSFAVSGANPGVLAVGATAMAGAGKECKVSRTFSATYSADAPEALYVAKHPDLSPPPSDVALCSVAEFPCSEANVFPSGMHFAGNATGVYLRVDGSAWRSCLDFSISGETTSSHGEPMTLEVQSWSNLTCTSVIGGSCIATTEGLPYDGALSGSEAAGDGSLGIARPEWFCGALKCRLRAADAELPTRFVGGQPAQILIEEAPLEYVSGTPSKCYGENLSLIATINMSTPNPLYVAESPF